MSKKLRQIIENSQEFTETEVWSHLKFEGVYRSTVYKRYRKLKNRPAVDQQSKYNRNRYKHQVKKKIIIEKVSIRLALVT